MAGAKASGWALTARLSAADLVPAACWPDARLAWKAASRCGTSPY
jgi:hypothetical protein